MQNPAYGFADPAGGADSTTAIQAALTAGAGKRVYLPGGAYLISSDLSVPSGTTVYGDGRRASPDGGFRYGTYTGATGPNLLKVSGASHVIIRDLAFNGNSADLTYGGQHNYLHGGTGVMAPSSVRLGPEQRRRGHGRLPDLQRVLVWDHGAGIHGPDHPG